MGKAKTNVGASQSSYGGQTGPDKATQAYIDQIRQAATAAGAAGPGSLLNGAAGYNTGLINAGNTGLAALSGDPTATAALMDPYQKQVVDATNAQFDMSGRRAVTDANSGSTLAGAFGGSRSGVAQGVATAQNELNRNSTVSGLLSSGFNNTMARAGTLAAGGFQGAGANANLGLAGVGNQPLWLVNMLKNGFTGLPYGQSSSGNQNSFNAQAKWNQVVP